MNGVEGVETIMSIEVLMTGAEAEGVRTKGPNNRGERKREREPTRSRKLVRTVEKGVDH